MLQIYRYRSILIQMLYVIAKLGDLARPTEAKLPAAHEEIRRGFGLGRLPYIKIMSYHSSLLRVSGPMYILAKICCEAQLLP